MFLLRSSDVSGGVPNNAQNSIIAGVGAGCAFIEPSCPRTFIHAVPLANCRYALGDGVVVSPVGLSGGRRITRAQIGALPLATATRESTWAGLIADYTKSVAYISLRTVPLLVIGIWASMWIMSRVTLAVSANSGRVLAIVAIAFLAVLLALPSLFEIPLAVSVLAAGGPAGAAAALLFAGPAINLPSLLVIGRFSNWRVAVVLAAIVWGIAVAGGLMLRS
jgi:Predicted permease